MALVYVFGFAPGHTEMEIVAVAVVLGVLKLSQSHTPSSVRCIPHEILEIYKSTLSLALCHIDGLFVNIQTTMI